MLSPIVSSKLLNEQLTQPDLVILDASLKKNKTNLIANVPDLQIKNARYFDIKNSFSDLQSPYPNMLSSAEQFEMNCRKLGINQTSKIVVYDNLGVYSSPRVWWMFKTMGHKNVVVLNGGLSDWIVQGYETERQEEQTFPMGDFVADFQLQNVKDFHFLKKNLIHKNALVIDVRSANRFHGLVAEPREHLRRGHIPKSINIPFENLLKDGKYLSKSAIAAAFNHPEIKHQPLIFSCGSGVTACIALLASELILDNEKGVYDGSWTEWGQRSLV
jgi:thiosulfate/3-mercaptopyruvate sulfurtransferase